MDKSNVSMVEVCQLVARLADTLSGDIRPVVQAMVGLSSETVSQRPAANPLGWVPDLFVVCCRAYEQPVTRSIPVSACLMLLGIASSALDATQDGHDDLLNAYTSSLNTDHSAKQPYMTSYVVTSPRSSRFTQPHADAQSERQHRAAVVSNASIALIGLAWQALHKYAPEFGIEAERVVKLGELIAQNIVRVCEAQHQDLTAGQTPRLSLDEYEQLITGKAGAIAATACEAAAILAGADHHRIQWRTIGFEREIAKQLCDDYNDLEDDIASGRQVSHPILYALTVCDDDQRITILDLLDRSRSASSEAASALRELITLARELGAEYYWLASLAAHRERALAALEGLQLPAEAERWVHDWILRVAPVLPVANL